MVVSRENLRLTGALNYGTDYITPSNNVTITVTVSKNDLQSMVGGAADGLGIFTFQSSSFRKHKGLISGPTNLPKDLHCD
jgi:hypothetical protein